MSGMPDDWGAGGRAVRQSDGRRPRRSDGRHVRSGRAEDDAPELSLPDVPDDEDDPKTLAEDAQWAAKLRPGKAPSAGPATDPGGQAPAAPPSEDPWTAAPAPAPSTGTDPWETSASDGTGELWGAPSGSGAESTTDPWAPSQPAASTSSGDLWGASPSSGASTGDWSSPGGAFEPERPAPSWGLDDPPATSPAAGDSSGSWTGAGDATARWQPDAGAWSPEPSSPAPWEPEPPPAPPTSQQFPAAGAPRAPSSRPWETEPPLRPKAAAPVSEGSPDFGDLFAELARDREAEQPAPTPTDPRPDDQSVVQAAHAEARRLIEEATGRWLWDDNKRSASGGIAAPAAGSGTASAYGPPQPASSTGYGPTTGSGYGPPTASGPAGQPPGGYGAADSTGPGVGPGYATPSSFGRPGWSDPLPPPPVPDSSTPFGGAASFAPPGSAPAEVGPSATPPPLSRELSPTRPPGRHAADADEPGSRLWAPDRRAGEDDTGGVGWLWSVEEHGASPPVPGSWLREPAKPQAREVDGLARPIEGRRLRQLEGRNQGRRVRQSRRWPFRVAIAAWIVLFAVVCWLYVFPWLEGVLPENF